jgi:hypothetical protein
MIEGGTAYCAEQNRGGREARLNCVGGQRIIGGCQGRAADVFALELKLVAEGVGDGLKNQDGLFGDFRAYAVAGEDG